MSDDGSMAVNTAAARTGEMPGPGDAFIHYGLEHFGLDSTNVDADVALLQGIGAKLQ